jgi:hypothetical protein
MSNHPLNLLARFLLEIILLIVAFLWAEDRFSGNTRFLYAVGLSVLIALVWVIFKVDGDPGSAIVSIPGWLRLILEIGLFGLALYCLHELQYTKAFWIFFVTAFIHYLISYDRIIWLLRK